MKIKKILLVGVSVGVAGFFALPFLADLRRDARAADHGDGSVVSLDRSADLGDAYLFLDPADTNRVIMIMTVQGFIASGENGNFGNFAPEVRYRFELERTGDAVVDDNIDVTFAPRSIAATGQVATVKLPGGHSFTALSTRSSLATTAPAPILTTNDDGIIFFAGLVDDPFFFDIPGFNRFVASVLAGTPDSTKLNRGRDSFAGYNTMAIALSIPVDLVRPVARGTNVNHVLGLSARTQRRVETYTAKGEVKATGVYRNVDRAGIPAVNVALIPFAKKNRFNAATQRDDVRGEFAPDILATLNALRTSTNNQQLLASIAVAKGDFLRLDLTDPASGFPNGRRLHDDVIDIILSVVTNGDITAGDHVDANDVPFRTTFPFLGPPQQPRENPAPGVVLVDDNTRN